MHAMRQDSILAHGHFMGAIGQKDNLVGVGFTDNG